MTIHYRSLEPLTRETQCRCASSDGVRCDADKEPGLTLCTACMNGLHHTSTQTEEQALRPNARFGWWDTTDYDKRETATGD